LTIPPLHPRALELLLLLASEPHNATSAADALKASRASVVRWLAEARRFGAVVNWNRTRRRFEVAPATEREARRRLELLTRTFPPAS
jgi:diphthamide synthase subunit DPH2